MEEYIYKDNKKLKFGYTTGSCAAAAAKAAAEMLLSGKAEASVSIQTPRGTILNLAVQNVTIGDGWASCAVRKDAGDDPDVTDQVLVYARVSYAKNPAVSVEPPVGERGKSFERVWIDGGVGVGRVTKPGLDQKVGQAAINSTPRRMIRDEVEAICDVYDFEGALDVCISIPAGVELAKKTFNPRIGIEGGISVLGTTGIVEPMSEKALIDSIKVEMRVAAATEAEYIVVTPGNYGSVFIKETIKQRLEQEPLRVIKCSNFVGDVIDYAAELGFKGVLLIGHIGKFVKLAGGVMQTHSRYADCRMEILTAHSALAGAETVTLGAIMEAATTDEAIRLLDEAGLREQVISSILEKVDFHIKARTYGKLEIGAILFSNQYGTLGQTEAVPFLLERLEAGL